MTLTENFTELIRQAKRIETINGLFKAKQDKFIETIQKHANQTVSSETADKILEARQTLFDLKAEKDQLHDSIKELTESLNEKMSHLGKIRDVRISVDGENYALMGKLIESHNGLSKKSVFETEYRLLPKD